MRLGTEHTSRVAYGHAPRAGHTPTTRPHSCSEGACAARTGRCGRLCQCSAAPPIDRRALGIGMGETESAPVGVAAAKSAVPSGGTPSGGIPRRATRWSASKAQSASTATGSLGECVAEGSLWGVCGCGERVSLRGVCGKCVAVGSRTPIVEVASATVAMTTKAGLRSRRNGRRQGRWSPCWHATKPTKSTIKQGRWSPCRHGGGW